MIQELVADVIIIGGGLGGTSAALAAAKAGMKVVVTEETDWIGGQLTSQAVPPDEHRWIESFGCTASYREFRNRVRDYYKRNYPLNEQALNDPELNPGNAWVSRVAHEPKVALQVLEDMLAPYVNTRRIQVLLNTRPVHCETAGDQVASVTVEKTDGQTRYKLRGAYFLDATETGELLPLAGAEYVSGAEARSETNEPHALEQADPLDMQSITHVAAVEYIPDGNFTIPKPDSYDFWHEYKPSFS
ncbi:FAD-dependent oxidoreductase, partial [Paenibacillus sp. AR247]|uniref:FAD-dependent oxidoreductase n=2 Tax=Paenibacillus TaxID=44249 RepID=UPI000D410EAA